MLETWKLHIYTVNFLFPRPYFDSCATEEMKRDWRPLLCPLDVTFGKAVNLMELFLPTLNATSKDTTYVIWLEEMTGFWKSCGNHPVWEQTLLGIAIMCALFVIKLFSAR